jgi:hypothetical protein
MSQQLIPIDGGVQEIQTTTSQNRLEVVSQQYIQVKNLEERPTEWVAGGRPIYRRLPAASETYQIDFFNIVPAPNTAVAAEVQEIGYVYVPWGESSNGSGSLEVVASGNNENLLIKSGNIVWRYGRTQVLPTIVNIELLDVLSGQYDVAYQLVYDDSPLQKLYAVEDFSLAGIPLNVTSSTDNIVGWRYPAVNAFLNTTNNWWANRDTYFPNSNTYSVQPTQSFLQWRSDLPMAYSVIRLRCPAGTAYKGTATLSYVTNSTLSFVSTVFIQIDSTSQYFEFVVEAPTYQNGWKVEFSSSDIAVQSIEVSGVITQLEPQSEPSTRAVLVMYPSGALPKTVVNASGKAVPATYCPLAIVTVNNTFEITKVKDTRYIIHRDYMPVADWLTKPFDENLVDLYEQVEDYQNLWLSPPTCMKQEYASLTEDQIVVVSS